MNIPTDSESWLIEQARSNLIHSSFPADSVAEEIRRFTRSFWPFMESYYSPLKPVFSFELSRSPQLQNSRTCLFRDGAIPLLWFFETIEPKAIGAQSIVVHESLGALVPESWLGKVRFFDLYSESMFDRERPPEKLFLIGPVNHFATSLEDLSLLIAKIKAALGDSGIPEILLYAPVRHVESLHNDEESYECQFYHRIFSELGPKVTFVHWQSIEYGSYQNVAVVDLNGGWIYRDNAVIHTLLSRGAGLLSGLHGASAWAEKIPYSRRHGVRIGGSPSAEALRVKTDSEDLFRFYADLHRKVKSPRMNTPWPRWFQQGVRASSPPN